MFFLLVGASLAGTLADDLNARGLAADAFVIAFAPDAAIEAFAHAAVDGVQGASRRADRLYDAILALKQKRAIEGDRDNVPKARQPKTAAMLMQVAQAPTASDRRAGCYELTALYVAAARSVGLQAVGVERDTTEGTGQIGHVMAGVRLDGELAIYDLQNEARVARQRSRELSDVELAAHHYNHLAVASFLGTDLRQAEQAVDVALRLAPENPSFLNNKATVLAALDEPLLAAAYLVQAIEGAPRVPLYRYQHGRVLLAAGFVDEARRSLQAATTLRPAYGQALRDLGWAEFLAGDDRAAAAHLDEAHRREPDDADTVLYLGLFYFLTERQEDAQRVIDAARERDPNSVMLGALAAVLAGEPGLSPERTHLDAVIGTTRRLLYERSGAR